MVIFNSYVKLPEGNSKVSNSKVPPGELKSPAGNGWEKQAGPAVDQEDSFCGSLWSYCWLWLKLNPRKADGCIMSV